ncbi:MAG: hypothetical protein M0Z29_00410 [Actinomycetota bacterium]|nr:hypothetical protein [Actinomycetota bacterium]
MHQGRALLTDVPAAVRSDPRVLDAYLGGSEEEAEDVGVQAGSAQAEGGSK